MHHRTTQYRCAATGHIQFHIAKLTGQRLHVAFAAVAIAAAATHSTAQLHAVPLHCEERQTWAMSVMAGASMLQAGT